MKTTEQRLEAIEKSIADLHTVIKNKPWPVDNPMTRLGNVAFQAWTGKPFVSAPEPKRDWEVLEFRHNGIPVPVKDGRVLLSITDFLTIDGAIKYGMLIHSVRRTTDGQVFTVGDRERRGVITNFFIQDNAMFAAGEDWDTMLRTLMKEVIFTTADGVRITEGRPVYEVVGKTIFTTIFKIGKTYSGELYSTHEAAALHTTYRTVDGVTVKGFHAPIFGWNKYGTFLTSMAQKMDQNGLYYASRAGAETAYKNYIAEQRLLSLHDVLECLGDVEKLEAIVKARL